VDDGLEIFLCAFVREISVGELNSARNEQPFPQRRKDAKVKALLDCLVMEVKFWVIRRQKISPRF
jgi:hypothetical protein